MASAIDVGLDVEPSGYPMQQYRDNPNRRAARLCFPKRPGKLLMQNDDAPTNQASDPCLLTSVPDQRHHCLFLRRTASGYNHGANKTQVLELQGILVHACLFQIWVATLDHETADAACMMCHRQMQEHEGRVTNSGLLLPLPGNEASMIAVEGR